MSISLEVVGVIYEYPEPGDVNWGPSATAWAVAVTDGMLQKSGGAFTLLADVNFGASFGLVSKYYKSTSSNISTTGILRLANTDSISWRNGANNGNISIGIDSSNNLTFDGHIDLGAAYIGGNLSVNNLNSGTDANAGSFWCGDGTWKAPTGSGAVNSGTATHLAYYATSTNAVNSNSFLTVDGSGNLTATSFVGPVTGNVTGNLTGNVTGNVSGNAGTVTTIPTLSGDISNTGNATTVSKIQTKTVSGTTGTGNVVFSNSPTLVTPTLGAAVATTPSPGDSSTNVATTSFVATSFAPLASPHLIGIPTAPTASPGTNTTQLATTAFVTAAQFIKTIVIQRFNNSGTYTPSAGLIYAEIEMCGGGGGSAGATGNQAVPGGGGGGYVKALMTAAQIGASQTVTIGAAGAAGLVAGPTAGGNGGVTSLGSLASAGGGSGGNTVTTGGGGTQSYGGAGGGGNSISVGVLICSFDGQQGGAGGFAFYPSAGFSVGGYGGGCPLGMGASSNVAAGGFGGATGSGASHVGTGNGSGAGGSADATNTPQAGSAGAPGLMIIKEFCSA